MVLAVLDVQVVVTDAIRQLRLAGERLRGNGLGLERLACASVAASCSRKL